jgi:hypothetical protein
MAEAGSPLDELRSLAETLGGAAGGLRRTARSVPGLRSVEAGLGAIERLLLVQLKQRLDQLEPGPPVQTFAPEAGTVDGALAAPAQALQSAADRMRELLRLSIQLTPEQSRRSLHEALLRELVPDEARILSALSDGSVYPMVHIAEPGVGTYQKRVLENGSSVGRAAGVALPDRTHVYVAHLRRLGLVETGPEDPSMREEYDILLTDTMLRDAVASVSRGPRKARIIRRTIAISGLGRELWEATQRDDEPG